MKRPLGEGRRARRPEGVGAMRALVGILTFEAALALVVAIAGSTHRVGNELHREVILGLSTPPEPTPRAVPGPPEAPHPWTPPANQPFVLLPLRSAERELAALAAAIFLDEPRDLRHGPTDMIDRIVPRPPNRLDDAPGDASPSPNLAIPRAAWMVALEPVDAAMARADATSSKGPAPLFDGVASAEPPSHANDAAPDPALVAFAESRSPVPAAAPGLVAVVPRDALSTPAWPPVITAEHLTRLAARVPVDPARAAGGLTRPRGDAVRLAALATGAEPEETAEIERLIDLVAFTRPTTLPPFSVGPFVGLPTPRDSDAAATDRRKAGFVNTVLPIVERMNKRTLWIRRRILALGPRFQPGPDLSVGDARFVADTLDAFELPAWNYPELLRRVDVVPPSLALAQAAVESGWGSAAEGNALFGVQRFDVEGGRVVQRLQGYGSLAESVSHYMKTLNTHPAYAGFRAERAGQRLTKLHPEGLSLAARLERYSELGADYIRKVQDLMIENNFMIYDVLADRGAP